MSTILFAFDVFSIILSIFPLIARIESIVLDIAEFIFFSWPNSSTSLLFVSSISVFLSSSCKCSLSECIVSTRSFELFSSPESSRSSKSFKRFGFFKSSEHITETAISPA